MTNSSNKGNNRIISWRHHAYLVECLPSEHETVYIKILDGIDKSVTEIQKHNHDTLGVDGVRLLIDMYTKATFDGITRRIAFITAETITHEAQNALLKFFEETAVGNHFVVMIPSKQHLLPTFRSRFEEVNLSENSIKPDTKFDKNALSSKAGDFVLKMTPAERLKLATKMSEDLSDDKIKKTDILAFLHEVEAILTNELHKKSNKVFPVNPNVITAIEAVITAEKYLLDRSSSAKILLENLALSL